MKWLMKKGKQMGRTKSENSNKISNIQLPHLLCPQLVNTINNLEVSIENLNLSPIPKVIIPVGSSFMLIVTKMQMAQKELTITS